MSGNIAAGGARGARGPRGPNPVRLCECFLAVVEEGHVGRAAQSLGIAQPPLSQSLRRLEELLGATLLVRHPKGVSLTPAGRRAVPRARALIEAEAALRASAAHDVDRDRPVLSAAPEIPDEWVLRWAAAADLAVRRSPSSRAVRELAGSDGAEARRTDPQLAVVVAPSVVGRHEAGPVVAVPQRLLCAAGARPGAAPVPEAGTLDAAGLRRMLALPVASAPRSWQPSAHDLLEDELRSAGSRAHPLVVQVPDLTAGLTETLSGRTLMLSPSATAPPGLVSLALPDGRLPLRLRVVVAAGGGAAEETLLHAAAREITADLQALS